MSATKRALPRVQPLMSAQVCCTRSKAHVQHIQQETVRASAGKRETRLAGPVQANRDRLPANEEDRHDA